MASLVGFVYFLLGMIVIFTVIGILFLITYMTSHRLRIRDPIKKDTYITDYWVWEKKDPDTGIIYWKSVMSNKVNTPKPPAEAVNVGKKGKKFAEAYQLSADEFIWITDKGINLVWKEVEVKDKGGKTLMKNDKPVMRKEQHIVDLITNKKTGKTEYKYIDTFKPYTAVQRETLIAQHKKADEIKRNKWTPDKIITITSIGALVMLVVMLMIFWGDIAKPALESQQVALQQQKMNGEITNQLAIMLRAVGYDVGDVKVSQTPKKQNTGNTIKTKGEEPPMAE